MIQERRHFQRVEPDSPVVVLLGESKHSLLIDLCEEGIAVDGFAARRPGEVIPFAFGLPEGNGYIQGRAEIVWTNDSEHRTGLRVLDLAGPCREQFVGWISARAFTMRSVDTEKEPIEPDGATDATRTLINPIFHGSQDGSEPHPAASLFPHLLREEFEPINPELGRAEEFANDRKSSLAIVVALALMLLSSVLGFLVYHSRAVHKSPQPSETTAPAEAPILPTNDVTAPEKPTTARTPSSASSARLDLPGFVLQAGAMKQEANADALAQDLREKNFPAFVFTRGADSFYRVAVGPYSTEDSAVRVKGELQKDGFKTFSRRRVPE